MATDWEGSPRTESRMFALGFETKQKKWCRETCRVYIWPSTHPSTELSCRASHQSCPCRLMVGSPGPTVWAGQGLSPQPISHTGDVSMAWMGCGTACKPWALQGALWGQLTPAHLPLLPWGSCSSLASSHGHLDESQHSTACFIPQKKFPNTTQHHKPGTITLWQTHTTVMGQL